MATTFVVKGLKWVGNANGKREPLIIDNSTLLEANSQCFYAGDIIYLNAGAVTEWSDHATNIIGGIALAGSSSPTAGVTSGNAAIPFLAIRPGDIFEASLDGASAAASASTVGMPTTRYGLKHNADGIWSVDVDDVTDIRCKVLELVTRVDNNSSGLPTLNAMGDYYTRVLIEFLARPANGAASLLQYE
jgi:hypothetical protein